ncbi:hypothetical protein CERZMDRAFT_102794 [Cercospora zeae-maydis SCOH1-5]|uniref:Uncharacterized protein n=1 Tax=Cercospora zeae-maydis SCOH1-5 TaxID=717836 RepID=A0A6A6F429_9PEZI|nr:hypothetical protein CERZMDRAFT_102794 [Cercospora zeae-maydis SCOH1-5]
MSSSPVRCDHFRLHRDPETVCECREGMQEHVRAAEPQAIQAADQRKRKTHPRLRRGRKSTPSSSTTLNPDPEGNIETSPLARFSTTATAPQLASQRGPLTRPWKGRIPAWELPEQLNSDPGAEVGDNITVASTLRTPMSAMSPASTQIVEETPLSQLTGHQRRREVVNDTPAPASRRASANAPEVVSRKAGSVHCATHPDQATEIARLRQSRNVLVQSLEASTANFNRLQARILATRGDNSAVTEELQNARLDRERAVTALAGVNKSRGRDATGLLVFLFVAVMFLLVWVWVNGPEYEYIRKRRVQVLCE